MQGLGYASGAVSSSEKLLTVAACVQVMGWASGTVSSSNKLLAVAACIQVLICATSVVSCSEHLLISSCCMRAAAGLSNVTPPSPGGKPRVKSVEPMDLGL